MKNNTDIFICSDSPFSGIIRRYIIFNLSGIITKLDLCNFVKVLWSYFSCNTLSLSLTIWSADDLLIVVHLKGGVGSISLESDDVMVPIIQPPPVVRDFDVLRAEVVGDGDDAVGEGEHEEVPAVRTVDPEQDRVPFTRDEGKAEAVRLKQDLYLSNLTENQNFLRCRILLRP